MMRAKLEDVGVLELGAAPDPFRVPAVLEAASASESREFVRAFEQIDGIRHVDIAFVDISESDEVGQKRKTR